MSQLLRVTLPNVSLHAPSVLLTQAQAAAASEAVQKAASFVNLNIPLATGLEVLADGSRNLEGSRIMEEVVNQLRGELYVGNHDDPARRFEIHQLLMTAGFYARAASVQTTKLDPLRFVSNHYNFDVRRDKIILGTVKEVAFGTEKESNNQVVSNLLHTERLLFGQNRLLPVSGRQYLLPGISLRLVKTEGELKRLLALKPVAEDGNFAVNYVHDDIRVEGLRHIYTTYSDKALHDRWTTAIVSCKPEETAPLTPPTTAKADDTRREFRLRVLLPPPPMSFVERLKETLLQLWVYWFGFWILFWMVDEEVITLAGLIWARYKQLQVLKEEAKKSGGKVYMASSKWT